MSKATRKIQLHLEREENWYPVIEVPADMSDDEALERIEDLCPDEVYDEMNNKDTYDFGYLSVSVHCSANDDAEVQYSLVPEDTDPIDSGKVILTESILRHCREHGIDVNDWITYYCEQVEVT